MRSSRSQRAFLDSSLLVALTVRDDEYHGSATLWRARIQQESWGLVTHIGVLLEVGDGFARLARRAAGVRLVCELESSPGLTLIPLEWRFASWRTSVSPIKTSSAMNA